MTGRARVNRVQIRRLIENAIRDRARRGGYGYDELARAVMDALERNHLLADHAKREDTRV